MTAEPEPLNLHLGWLYEEPKILDKSQPLHIDFENLEKHSVILAQSGGGKSSLVGRIVEEILIKTSGRVVVIDTNADFRKSHLVTQEGPDDKKVWTDDARPLTGSFDRNEFVKRWEDRAKLYLTNSVVREANRSDPAESKQPDWIVPYVSWNELPRPWQLEVLGLELSRHPNEVAAFYRVARRLGDEEQSQVLVSPSTVGDELKLLAATSTVTNRLDERVAVSLQVRCQQAAELDLWRTDDSQSDLARCLEGKSQLVVLDIPAVSKGSKRVQDEPKRGMILFGYLLDALWNLARKQWDEAVSTNAKDQRRPTFLVVDEAHNFVPDKDPTEPLALRVSSVIQRIAAEGRKYGLYLLLVTQRPQKIRQGLLWECENLCLLRLQSPTDLEFAQGIWGFELPPSVTKIAKFPPGRGMLFGPWSNGEPKYFQAGLRRTKETGGNLNKNWILNG